MKSLGNGNGWTTLHSKLLHGVKPSLELNEGSTFTLNHKIVNLLVGELDIDSYTAAESGGIPPFKQFDLCRGTSDKFYKLLDYIGTKIPGENEQHT